MPKQKYYVVWKGRKPGVLRPGRNAPRKWPVSMALNINPLRIERLLKLHINQNI